MIIEPPGTRYYYPTRQQVILKCNIQDMSFLFSQLYNAFLILISTVYAVKTRQIPENFNESKFIGFTMYTTCVIWLAFIPIYFGAGNAENETQITTLCVTISMSASVTLICLYSPKIYIILFQPDKNIRGKVTMGGSTFKKQSSSAGTSSVTKCKLKKKKKIIIHLFYYNKNLYFFFSIVKSMHVSLNSIKSKKFDEKLEV